MTASSPQSRRALVLAIEQAFFMGGSAAAIARNFSSFGHVLHASDVRRIWAEAKAAGRLPKIQRPMAVRATGVREAIAGGAP